MLSRCVRERVCSLKKMKVLTWHVLSSVIVIASHSPSPLSVLAPLRRNSIDNTLLQTRTCDVSFKASRSGRPYRTSEARRPAPRRWAVVGRAGGVVVVLRGHVAASVLLCSLLLPTQNLGTGRAFSSSPSQLVALRESCPPTPPRVGSPAAAGGGGGGRWASSPPSASLFAVR